MIGEPSERHVFVYCAPEQASEETIDTAHPQDMAVIIDWIRVGRPLIARMRRSQDPVDRVALGLPLPPALGKKRIMLTAERSLLRSLEHPPRLQNALAALPAQWRPRIERLCMNLTAHDADVRVIGSLAWQHLTGVAYLHPQSDIDVVLHMTGAAEFKTWLDLLMESDLSPGPRIDGEIVMPGGDAVSWRELCTSSKDLLVKNIHGPRIALRGEWLSQERAL